MIPKYSTLRLFWFNQSTVVANMMKFNSQNSSESLYNSLNFAQCGPPYDPADMCAARIMTRLIGVRPAVDLSWKALPYKFQLHRMQIFVLNGDFVFNGDLQISDVATARLSTIYDDLPYIPHLKGVHAVPVLFVKTTAKDVV